MGLPAKSFRTFLHAQRPPSPSLDHLSRPMACTHAQNAVSLQICARMRRACWHVCARCQRILGRPCLLFPHLAPVFSLRTCGVLFEERLSPLVDPSHRVFQSPRPTREQGFRFCGGFVFFLSSHFSSFCRVSCRAFFRRVLVEFTEKSVRRGSPHLL